MAADSSASLSREVGQQAGEAAGQHGLAGARRADQQQVMAAGGGHLQRAPGGRVTAHVRQVLGLSTGRSGPALDEAGSSAGGAGSSAAPFR